MEGLKAIAREALETFEAISNAARERLRLQGITLNALASINEMTASNVAAEMRQMNDQRQSDCVKLRREPAIGRRSTSVRAALWARCPSHSAAI